MLQEQIVVVVEIEYQCRDETLDGVFPTRNESRWIGDGDDDDNDEDNDDGDDDDHNDDDHDDYNDLF